MKGGGAAFAAIVLGLASLAAIPVGVLVSQKSASIGLLESLYYSVPAGAVLGIISWSAGRRARFAFDRSVTREGIGVVRTARLLGWAGMYVALIGGIALGVYAALHFRN